MRGELDWIVMKALEKDRNRRYETASGFAADIERHLHDEPVQAGPPSAAYRFRKFARRNKGPVLAAAVVLLALVGGIVGTTLRAGRAREQARRAEADAAPKANGEADGRGAGSRDARRCSTSSRTRSSPPPGRRDRRAAWAAT